jgi:DnaJ-domain-containing protein 1
VRVTLGEIIVSLVCLAAGYWLVSKVLGTRDAVDRAEPSIETDSTSSANPDGQESAEEGVTYSNWFRVLEVSEHASPEEVKTAYKRKISQYHPDKVAQMGEEIRALAGRKSQQINAAYELGMRTFGASRPR